MDIEISLKPAKKPKSVKPKYVQELFVTGHVAFFHILRRMLNSSLWRSRLISIVPSHIIQSADRFRSSKRGTLKSILQSYLAWIRNLGDIKGFGILSTQSVIRNLLLLNVFGLLTNAKLEITYQFPVRLTKENSCLIHAKFLLESQEVLIDCVDNEFLKEDSGASFPTVCIKLKIGDAVNLSFDKAGMTKQIEALLSNVGKIYGVIISNFPTEAPTTPADTEIPSKASQIKNHPIFILESHLKKYEILYPPEIAGFLDSDTVYYRKNVRKLRSKEAWLTQFGMSIKV